ncbi:MAG: hypothetical protein Q9160_008889 [Pyrenula sp. 1 TL-2023]
MASLSKRQTIETEKEATDFAGSTVEAGLRSPGAPIESERIHDTSSTKQGISAPQSDRTENSEFQPQAPTRSVTVNEQTFERFARLVEQVYHPGTTEQPIIVNFGKIEIINGSVARSHPVSPMSASDVQTIDTNPDRSGHKIKRSESQMTQTTRVALERFSNICERLVRLSRPKPFTVRCLVKNAVNKWQELEVKLDTGGEAGNLIPYSQVKALGLLEYIRPSNVTVFAIGGNQLKTEGALDIVGKWNGPQEKPVTFQVVDKDNRDVTETMFGADAISTFKLLRIRFAGTTGTDNGHSYEPITNEVTKAEKENMKKAQEKIAQNEQDKKKRGEQKKNEEERKSREQGKKEQPPPPGDEAQASGS